MQVNRNTNAVILAIGLAFVDTDYNLRSVAAVRELGNNAFSEADVLRVADELGCSVKTRGSDGAKLISEPDYDPEVLVALGTALSDVNYTYRTVTAVAEKAFTTGSVVEDIAEEIGYSTGKTRRRDGARLVGLSA